jgi:Ca-activated chloride channel family protein
VSIFATPSALPLLLVLPALWVLTRHAISRRQDLLRRFGEPDLLARSSSLLPPRLPAWRRPIGWLGLAAVILALARPQWGTQARALVRSGRDILVALDLSRSMRVTDAGGERLRTAKRLAWQLAAARPGDRIGLVIFGGAGFLQLPPTTDFATFQLFLDAASFDDVGDPASDLAAGLRVAERALRREGSAAGSRAVLLLSDGERSEGTLDHILDTYRRARLPVLAVGIGTVDGGRVPADSAAASGPWHVDNIGRPVISRLDEETLQRIAEQSGGAYARWDDAGGLEKVRLALADLEAQTRASQRESQPREQYQLPLLSGILMLVMASLPTGRGARGRRKTAPEVSSPASPQALGRVVGRVASLVIAGLLLSCTTARRDTSRGHRLYEAGKYLEAYEAWQAVVRQQGGADHRYNTGNALYRMHQYAEAAKTWRDAMGGAPADLRQHAFYNMGNAFVRAAEDANALSGYLERAVDAYEEALRLNPGDADAKWNLEIALQRRGDVGQEGSLGRGGRADYGVGSREAGYEGSREAAVGAMAGGGQGGDEGESVDELDPDQARALLEAVERQQLSTHEGRRPRGTPGGGRDW